MKKKIVLKGGQPLNETKVIEVGGDELELHKPTSEAWLEIKSAMFDGTMTKISMENYRTKICKEIISEEFDIYQWNDEELSEIVEEIKTFVEEEVEETEVELTLQAINSRWSNKAKDKYLLNGQPDFVGYAKDALKNVCIDAVKLEDLSPVQAGQLRGELTDFFRKFKYEGKKKRKGTYKRKG